MSSPPKDEVVCPTRTDMKKYWEVNAKVSMWFFHKVNTILHVVNVLPEL